MALVLVSLAWLAAMAAVGVWDAPWWMGAAWALALLPLAGRWGRRGWVVGGACVVAAVVGGARFASWGGGDVSAMEPFLGREIVVEGTIASEVDPGRTVARYGLDVDLIDGREVDGKVLISLNQYDERLPGERVSVEGKLEAAPSFDGFDYRGYLARQGVAGTMLFPRVERLEGASTWSWSRRSADVRLELERSLQRALPEPEASLAAGIVFGRDANLPDELAQDFRDSGLAHLTAVSGSNVTIITGLVFYVLTPLLGRRRATPLAGVAMVLYLVAAGLSWSVIRAGLMAAVFLAGLAIGRPQASLPALGLAAIVITAVQPSAAVDAGFQLSLAATAGIIVFAPWLRAGMDAALARVRLATAIPNGLVQISAMSAAASLATLPLQWVVFERVSVVGVLANVVVEPVFALAMVLSGLTAVAGIAWEPAGWACGLVAYYPLAFTSWAASAFASVPVAAVDMPGVDPDWAIVAYVALMAAAWPAYRRLAPAPVDGRREPGAMRVRRVAFGGVAGAAVIVSIPLTVLPTGGPGDLEIAILDVGQGDAILVTTPHGKQVLVDGGPSGIALARELGGVMAHWDRSLDAVVLTHPQEDHVGGLPAALRRFDVARVYTAGDTNRTMSFAAFETRASARPIAAGERFELDGVTFEVLWPPHEYASSDLNDRSVVLAVNYRGFTALLTGDIEAAPQRELLAAGIGPIDLLKVPHHGSKTGDPAFLRDIGAAVGVISVGADNRFGHPHEETLVALSETRVYRTDRDGRVVVSSDGIRIRVRTER